MKRGAILWWRAVLSVLIITSGCLVPVSRRGPKKGPPPHAPARGYRRKHVYRYYPSAYVYFDVERELYFYRHGDRWTAGAKLPARIHIDKGEAVSLSLGTDEPYRHFHSHKKAHPPGQVKKGPRAPAKGPAKGRPPGQGKGRNKRP